MFLKYAPKLKSLVIEEVTNWDYSFESKFAPKHLPCLQSVELRKFEGGPEEMEFVEYILKAGLVLKKMQIFFYYSLAECEIDVYQDLLVLPRSSGICRVEVVREC
uniref:FBD domain-containing protein n=1 Tax=Opuntia streptacantha TaxID=393608 RepID=A0A7C9A4E1_OPUST